MADNTIKVLIELEKGGATASLKNFEGDLIKSGVAVGSLRKELGNFVIHSKKMSSSVKLTQRELKSLEKSVGGFTSASGAATSAAMELGRVVSDAPYGIRGMANNITQLVSQLGFAANAIDKTTGKSIGWMGAIKNMAGSLTGTLGVVFAITAVTSALDYFYGAAEKAEEKTSDLTSELENQVEVLNGYKNALEASNITLEQRAGIIKAAALQDSEFLKILKETGDGITEQHDALLGFIRGKNEELEVKKKVAKLDEINKKLTDEEANSLEKLISKQENLILLRNSAMKSQSEGSISAVLDLNKRIKKNQDLIDLHERRKQLVEDINREISTTQDERPEEGSAAYYKLHIANLEKIRDKTAKTRKEYDLQTSSIDVLRRKLKELVGDKKVKAKKKDEAEVLLDIYGIDTSDAARQKYIDKLVDMFDFGSIGDELQVAPKLDFKLSEETQAGIDAYNKLVGDMISDKFDAERISGFADKMKEALSSINDFTNALFDRQLVTEQNRTNELNAELNNRLLNENLSADKRADIQNQIAQNDEKLRKKQNEIKKKAFNTNKAFQLSMAVADTASSVLKAYGSQLIVGDPTSIIRAKVAAGLAGAMGALQIATIATQKFQPDAASTPIRTSGGAGGGLGNRSFDFNLVGNNQGNQVVDAIQSQFDKPIKAYVVSKDITNAQQLDANTKSSARFGG